ncbi:methyltransferase TRM13-domain-containing protein [Gongronella butleri]|nr:methyltransferase TRM13-domain-containing protein [Gongronella butleri]
MPKESILQQNKQKKTEAIPPVPDKPQQCHYYVQRKRRYCGLPAKRGVKFCGEHLTEETPEDPNDEHRRVPCPYDPGHSVVFKVLEAHMAKCNARPRPPPAYHSLNVNVTLPLSAEELAFQQTIYNHKNTKAQPWISRVRLHELDAGELDRLITAIQKNAAEIVPAIPTQILTHPSMVIDATSIHTVRHLHQQSSLIGHMQENGMLDLPNPCYVEFGAGKGELAHHVNNALPATKGHPTYVLIDRKSVRNKFDQVLMGKGGNEADVHRILMDIKDLTLANVPALVDSHGNAKKMVCISKHLCGSATDITLKCLVNYVKHEMAAGNENPVAGIVIALCCHQQCRYEMYPNTAFLDRIGLAKPDFDRLCKISSWACCGRRATDDDHAQQAPKEELVDDQGQHYSGRPHEDREKIGYQSKRLLDMGRVEFLEQNGFDARLVYYADPANTLENCALIAVPKASN